MDWDDIENMTNKQAAEFLRQHLKFMSIARGNGKTMHVSMYVNAICKAIIALENTPDKEEQ